MNDRLFNRTVQTLLEMELTEGEVKSTDQITQALSTTLLEQEWIDAYLRGPVLTKLIDARVQMIFPQRRRATPDFAQEARPRERPGQPVRVHPQRPEVQQLEERIVRIGSEIGPVSQMKVRIEKNNLTQRFWQWKEFDPRTRIEIELPKMTRQQLLDAAEYRHNKASEHVHNAAFLRSIAAQLGPRQTVGEVFDDRTLTDLWTATTESVEISTKTIASAEPTAIERTAS